MDEEVSRGGASCVGVVAVEAVEHRGVRLHVRRPGAAAGQRRRTGCHMLLACLGLWSCVARADGAGSLADVVAQASSRGTSTTDASVAPQLRFFGAEHGLSRQINDIAMGYDGRLWLATMDGLARYDGQDFRFWRRVAGASESLPDNAVTALHLDRAGTLWAATWSGLAAMDTRGQSLRRIRLEAAEAGCVDQITAMDSLDGVLWVATSRGLLCALQADGMARMVPISEDPSGDAGGVLPVGLLVESAHSLLLASESGLLRIHLASGSEPPRSERLITGLTTDLRRDLDGTIWVGNEHGLLRIGADGGLSPAPWRLPDHGVMGAVVNRQDGGYWIVATRALHRRSSQRDVSPQSALLHFDRGLVTGVEDLEGGLWLVTHLDGLAYLPPEHARFALMAGRPDNPVRAMAVDAGGTAWAAYEDGVGILSGGADRRDSRGHGATFLPVPGLDQPFSITACAGALWLLDLAGVIRLDPGSGRAERWLRMSAYRSDMLPQALECDSDGHVWTAQLGGGLVQYRRNGQRLRSFSGEAVAISDPRVHLRPQRASDGALWFTGTHELLRWDGAQLRRHPIVPGEHLYALAFDGPDTLWVARYGSLERYRLQGSTLRRLETLDEVEGVPAVEVSGIVAAENGPLWLTTLRGVLQVDPRSRRSRLYTSEDGLPDSDFMSAGLQPLGDGHALAATPSGVVRFDLRQPLLEARPPRLRWDALRLRRGEDDLDLDVDSALRVLPGDRDLRVVVRLMTFSSPAGHRYAFRLHGYDPDWVHHDGERLANPGERVFSQLAPGRYTLEVRGQNAAGAWSAPLRLPIEVMPPWWRTIWAMLLAMLVFASVVFTLALLHRRRLLRRYSYQLAQQRRAMAEEASLAKSRFLADLGHELRTPMTGVLGMAELLQHSPLDGTQRGRVRAIRRAGEHLLRLVDDALDLARIEAGRLHLGHERFSLRAVLTEVQTLIAPQADAKGLAFVLRTSPDVADARVGDAQRLRQVLLNLLGNAVKFTARGEVALEVASAPAHVQAGALCLYVRDTGPGMTSEQSVRLFQRFEQAEGARTAARYGGTGLGLAISLELVHTMGGEIAVDTAPGVGTDFRVLLPLEFDPSDAPGAASDMGNAAAHDSRPLSAAPEWPTVDASPCLAPEDGYSTPETLELLLVEDDSTVAEVIVGLLHLRGHRVTHAAHGLAAMMDIAATRFDLALVDLDLPGIDGCSLAMQLRATGFTAPLLAITARADADAEPQARAAGFDGFLRKPLSGAMLDDAIAPLIGATPRGQSRIAG